MKDEDKFIINQDYTKDKKITFDYNKIPEEYREIIKDLEMNLSIFNNLQKDTNVNYYLLQSTLDNMEILCSQLLEKSLPLSIKIKIFSAKKLINGVKKLNNEK